VIAHAAPTTHGNPWNSEMVDAMVTDAEAVVDEAMSHLVIPPHLSVRRVVEPVPPVALLSRLAEQAEFVALGRENLAPSRRLTEGAVTAPICAAAPCPAVVVPAYLEATSRQPVVVAVDGTTAAASALRVGFDEAAIWHLPLTVLHARPDDDTVTDVEERRVNIEEILAGWKAEQPDVSVHSDVVPGDPAVVIAEYSEHAALVVVGRPHRRRLGSWARSVANSVLSHCECPLVVVPESAPPFRTPAVDRRLAASGR
jgi:nucleotide-binding universal stress UspA family protein